MKLLLISDIHGNYPALAALADAYDPGTYDLICNCGDSTVYAPFANETIDWLQKNRVVSIRGNTDDKVIRLLKGKTFKKPGKPEKRIMYTSTAETLSSKNRTYLLALKKKRKLNLGKITLGMFHGSPADHDEFLFSSTPEKRFAELAEGSNCDIIVTGHSHSPFHKEIAGVHFINPGSVGRMFDGNPELSFAELKLENNKPLVTHHRLAYDIDWVVRSIREQNLPAIYGRMYRLGKKLN